MRDYELSVVVRPDIDDNQTKAAAARVQDLITSRSGEITNVQQWGKRRLAYRIAPHQEGMYFVYRLRMEPENAAEVEHELNLDEQVLRFIMLYLDPVALEALKNPPAPMAPRPERRPPPPPVEAPAEAAVAQAAPAADAAEGAVATAEGPTGAEAVEADMARTPRSRPAAAVATEEEAETAVPGEGESAAATEAPAAEEAVEEATEDAAGEAHSGQATEA